MLAPARRLQQLPPYVFAALQELRDEARARGDQVFDLTVGNPDGRPPDAVIEALADAARAERPSAHGYPPFKGSPELRAALCAWYERRFNVHLDPTREVLPLIGSKEGLYHLMQAYLDPGDTVLIPTPCYPAYLGAARLAEAEIAELALREENGFRLRFEDVDAEVARAGRMLLLNYPNNPTGAICDLDHWRDAVAFARDHDILLVSDIAYSELSLVDRHQPCSVLELPGARETAVEFQSLSKSHSMAGWRIGFCVGNAEVVANLAKLKSNVDFGVFLAVQQAAVVALEGYDAIVAENRARYRARRDRICSALRTLGWPVRVPEGAMYVWSRIPASWGEDDVGFVRTLFERSRVLLSPGSGFGTHGTGYVRLSLVMDEASLDEVARRIEASGVLDGP